MAYEPTNWKAGDVVTSAKLNKLEQGVAAGGGNNVVIGTVNGNKLTLENTWQEIWDNNCTMICVNFIDYKEFYRILRMYAADDYSVIAEDPLGGTITINAENANGYPVYEETGGDT